MKIVSINRLEEIGSPKIESGFRRFFDDELRKVLWSEFITREMLPFLIKHAHAESLSRMLGVLFLNSENHISRLEEIFSMIELDVEEKECDAIKGLIDSVWLLSCSEKGKVRDASILLIAQRIVGYQVISYRMLNMHLHRMKKSKASHFMDEILEEKKKIETKLANLAMYINHDAMFAGKVAILKTGV